MLTKEFDYTLPQELIAQEPIEPRDASRLLVLDRATGTITHRRFHHITDYLRQGDVLVVNETRVIPARLYAHKVPTGGKVEMLLLARRGPTTWESLVKGRKVMVDQRIVLGRETSNPILGTVTEITPSGGRLIVFEREIESSLAELGTVPLPPYIERHLENPERYQTVYAETQGSVAAPTAGLHFTPELIERTQSMGISWERVLLHIGLDTFRPVQEEVVQEHKIHTEYCRLSSATADRINAAKREGRRIIAVGTTSVRVLETAARSAAPGEAVAPWDGPTDLFIYPGYRFQAVDALITNFHLPRSSLLMLVSAFADLDMMQMAYQTAVAERYRFYSFGDSMLIL